MTDDNARREEAGASRGEEVIPIIPGDGVGGELAEAASTCLEALQARTGVKFTLVSHRAGYECYLDTGDALPESTVSAMRASRAVLLGAISARKCPPPSPVGRIRKLLGLFCDIRHCVSIPGSPTAGVDVIIARECSEGFLSDRNMFAGSGEFMPTPDMVLSVRVITRAKCDRVARFALEYARAQGRKRIAVAHKSAVFPLGCGLFRERFADEAARFADIEVEEEPVDEMAGNLAVSPQRYDTIIATNLFGDILAGIGAAHVGNLCAVGNFGQATAVFYPVHGALPLLAGKQRVNPLAMLRAVVMMLRWLGFPSAGSILEGAMADVCSRHMLGESPVLPGGLSTRGVADLVAERIADGPTFKTKG